MANAKTIAEAKSKQDSLVFAQNEAIKKHNEEVLKNKKLKKTEKVKSDSSAIEKTTPAIQTKAVSISSVKVFPNPFSELCNKRLIAGDYQFKWNASDVPQGVYIIHVVMGGHTDTVKVVKK